jgi:hypothetical protein
MYEFSAESYLKPQGGRSPIRKGEIAEILLASMREGYETGDLIELEDQLEHFHPKGLYGRKQFLAADSTEVGKVHRRESITILLSGELIVVTEDGERVCHVAPDIWITPVGTQRVIYAVTDSEWIGIWPTEKTGLAEIEDELTCMSMAEYLALEG